MSWPRTFLLACAGSLALATMAPAAARSAPLDLSSGPWRLLIDKQAPWREDPLFLPEQVDLHKLPVNTPPGGWAALSDTAGIPVKLPSTVEEHYWGKLDLRPYFFNNECAWALQDPYLLNGSYQGVSWWYKTFSAPAVPPGSRVLLHLPGERLRAEIYVNGQLRGYSILSELPVDADITSAVRPGTSNQLAIRITNAGGRWDWRDRRPFVWGAYTIPSSIGASGLDTGITLEVVNAARVSDLAVFNQSDPHSVMLQAEVQNDGASYAGSVLFTIQDGNGATVQTLSVPATVAAGSTGTFSAPLTLGSAALWTLDAPALYTATAALQNVAASAATRTFGFRSFEAAGIGTNAILRLNQHRIVIRSAISWNFWAPNALWPTVDAEQREVQTAKAMGLNCLHSHRNLSRPMSLDAQDRAGLLRVEEPGAGEEALGPNATPKNAVDVTDTSGAGGDPENFTQQYEEDKILAMVKRDRSHPSLIEYTIQNELPANLHDQHIFNLMRKMYALDPSRLIVLKSGGVNQCEAYMLPYDGTIYVDDGTGYSGWHDDHTVGAPGTFSRELYLNPGSFPYLSTDTTEILVWGEMWAAGTPDDHRRIVADYVQSNSSGYDRDDESMVDSGYAAFLQQYGFTTAFPTTSALYRSISEKAYYQSQIALENARMCDANDIIVLSGWESTTIDNHSGFLDAHRVPKQDPAILAQANAPLMLVVRPRRFVLTTNQPVQVDVFVVNEVGLQGPAKLTLTATGPTGATLLSETAEVNIAGGEVFGQLLMQGFDVPGAALAGNVTITATLAPAVPLPAGVNSASLVRAETVSVIAPVSAPLPPRVVLLGSSQPIANAFAQYYHTPLLPADTLQSASPVDAIVLSGFDPGAGNNAALLVAALRRVHDNGTRLIMWPDVNTEAIADAQQLAARNIIQFNGDVGGNRAPWMGTWYFVRQNPIFDGLPVDTALDHRYEMPEERIGEDGLLLNAPGMSAFVGYGRDHDPTVGIGMCVIPYGQGRIILSSLASEVTALTDNPAALPMPIGLRLLANAVSQPLP
jgi:beta-galactosidase